MKNKTAIAFFAGDPPGGGYSLECQDCGHTDNYPYSGWVCKGCNLVMEYPSGASW